MVVFAVESGMVGKQSVMHNAIGKVEVNGTIALGEFIARGQKTPFHYTFHKEQGAWKMDITSLFPVSRMAFAQLLKDSGEAEDAFLLGLLAAVSGRVPGAEVWQPVR
jgi:hypothetical protein